MAYSKKIMSIKEADKLFPGLRDAPLIPTPGINSWFKSELQSRPGKMNGMFGRKHSPETITKMKANRKGKDVGHIRNQGKNNPMYGKGCTEERRQKISNALKGRKMTPEHIAKTRRRPSGV